MRDGGLAHGLGEVVEVCADGQPHTQEGRQSCQNGESKDGREDSRGRLGVAAEDVVDLGQFAVAERGLGKAERHVGVADDRQVEGVVVVGLGRAE